jgi:hypothetical protein
MLGGPRCEAILEEALAIEAQGGLRRPDGQRRTPGGTFMHLLRRSCTPEERRQIWHAAPAPRAQKSPPVLIPGTWTGLLAVKARLPKKLRGTGIMKLTFTGLPGKIDYDKSVVVFRIAAPQPANLPKELPPLTPDDVPPWTVVVPCAMWTKAKMAAAIAAHPTAKLLCEGLPVIKDGHCFLFATLVKSLWKPD